MKTVFISCAAGFATGALLPDVETQFEEFVKKYNKNYRDGERQTRLEIFKRNIVHIEAKNAEEVGAYGESIYGVNSLSDLDAVEFTQNYLGLRIPPGMHNLSTFVPRSSSLVPSSIDWVGKGAVTPIKNQGQCGSCWTFSTTGAIEGAWQIAHGKLVSLSEQQVVDCAHDAGQGCGGGWPSAAIKWEESQGICGESEYQYTGRNGRCHGCNGSPVLARGSVTGAQAVQASADGMRAALAEKPVSVCVDAESWQHYHGGIFSNCGTSLDHAVLAVGYDSSSWKVKNSWGTWWGDKGYIHLRMGNTCGVLNNAVVALVGGSPTPPTPPGPSPPTPPSPSPSPCHTCTWNSDCPSGQECYYPSRWATSGCCYSSAPSASGSTEPAGVIV